MSFVCITFLEFISPNDWNTPNVGTYLRRATEHQPAQSGYPVIFFGDENVSSRIYAISGWKDIEAHNKWISSAEVGELMKLSAQHIKMQGATHLAIEFGEIPSDIELIEIEKVDPSQPPLSGRRWSVVCKTIDDEGLAYRLSQFQGGKGGKMVGRRVNVKDLPA